MDFRERLDRAVKRGHEARDAKAREEAAKALSEEECRRLHSGLRDELSEHIDRCLTQLADRFPGFRLEPVVDDKGWGSAVRRDDLSLAGGKRDNLFSRLEFTVSPYNQYRVIEIVGHGTVRNRENFHRNHYQLLKDADIEAFKHMIEQWTLDYAEQYSAAG